MACLMSDVATTTGFMFPVRASLDPCGTDELRCTGKDANSHLPFPENCRQYLRCRGVKLTVEDCATDTFFDAVSRRCIKDNYQCQAACPDGVYAKQLDRTTLSSGVTSTTPRRLRPTPTKVRRKATTVPPLQLTTSQPDRSQTMTAVVSRTAGRPDGVLTSSTAEPSSTEAFQTSTSSLRAQHATSVPHDTGHVTPSTVAMTTAVTTRVAEAVTSASRGRQTVTSHVTTAARDVTAPRHDVMTGTLSPIACMSLLHTLPDVTYLHAHTAVAGHVMKQIVDACYVWFTRYVIYESGSISNEKSI